MRGRGEGTVYQLPSGKWRGQLTVETDPLTGATKRIGVSGESQKEVIQKLTSLKMDLQKGSLIRPTDITVSEWMGIWLTEYMKPHLRPTTWDSYETMIRCHVVPHLGGMKLKDLRSQHLQRLYNRLLKEGRDDRQGGLSPKTVRYIHGIIRGAMSQAVKCGLIASNPTAAAVPPRKEKKEIQPLTAEQVLRLLEAANGDRYYAAFRLEFMTGLRLGELLALTWDDIDLAAHLIRVRRTLLRVRDHDQVDRKTRLIFQEPKTDKARRILPLSKELVSVLESHRAAQDQERLAFGPAYCDRRLVFCAPDGNPIDPRSFTRRWERLLQNAGLPHVRFHDARHTFATMLLEAGEDSKIVQELLGHSAISVTLDIYSHVGIGLKRSAVDRLSGFLSES